MNAACLVGPQSVELRHVPDPVAPPDGLVLRMRACGVCGSDLRRWREGPPAGVAAMVQGHELAGEVVAVGPAVSGFRVGDRLAVAPDIHCGTCDYCRRGWFNLCTHLRLLGITPGLDGGFAEKVLLSGDVLRNGVVHQLPQTLGFHEGALAETLASVLAAHHKCETRLGETVVVLGAGPIGCLHAVVAHARGARVLIAEPNPNRRRRAATFGPDAVMDAARDDLVAEVIRLTDGLGADVVVCANPVGATQGQAVEMARRGGRIVVFGGLPKSDPMVSLNANRIHYGEQVVMGAFSYHPSVHEEALRILARGVVKAAPFVTHTRPLSKAAEAFALAASGEALKVMVEPD
ncbi:MAG: alcohol dehydrogenase catalytic domain-containing protein [Verrucomicrobia bacterium]|nr:alcohol dehydrogenase catalytic domain-containing protein [Verrucomicrobiota bacterium]